LGRFARYIADHKAVRKVFASGFVFITMVAGFTSQSTTTQVQADEIIIESQINLVTLKGMQYPIETVKVNQNYSFFHPGLDLDGSKGTPIKPIMPGVVSYAGWVRTGYGNLIILNHKNGLESYYAHLSKIEVKTGDTVGINTEIGQMGATGQSTGVHLHLEIHQNGVFLNPLNILSR
jgi:murein DD-endopeptidase MepM/ murein hydrolase activator NlpD